MSLQPKNAALLHTLGWIEHVLGNTQEAVKLFSDVVGLGTANPEVRLHAAIVFAASGALADAERQLKEALRLNPAFAERDEVQALRAQLAAAK